MRRRARGQPRGESIRGLLNEGGVEPVGLAIMHEDVAPSANTLAIFDTKAVEATSGNIELE